MRPLIEKLLLLKSAEIFAEVPEVILAGILESFEEVELPPENIITRQGEHNDTLSIILSGHVEIRNDDGFLKKVGPGTVIGEMSVLDPSREEFTAVTTEPVDVFRISSDRLALQASDHPDLSRALLKTVCRKLRQCRAMRGANEYSVS
jgi:CRP-like cAMP-binding protein